MQLRSTVLLFGMLPLLCFGTPISAAESAASVQPQLIPLPQHMQTKAGSFVVDANTTLAAQSEVEKTVANQFAAMLVQIGGLKLESSHNATAGITFAVDTKTHWESPEAYVLDVGAQGINVRAGDGKGLYYGAMTLLQLLTSNASATHGVRLPALHIEDAPRFAWRGVMLDSARHFQSVDDIKRLLDAMAQLKLDVFHWHLTDDQGWRFPVPGWPKLIEVGSCRIPAGDGGVDAATGKPVPYCGFYTEDEIRDVVAYAAARHIDVVPEVDIPGHATAAIAAYPQLGVSGKPTEVSNEWGVNTNLFNADDSTMRFLEDVLAQVVKLFPGKFVHIGGDEAVKDQWIASSKMQTRIRELGVKNEAGLQAWMVARLEHYLSTHGKRLLGWDEILEGDLPSSATVMSWRGTEGGIDAAKKGHDVVMSPGNALYLDYLQTQSPAEPSGRPAGVTLEQVYAFNPLPGQLDSTQAQHILGVQANIWTEHMRSMVRVEHAGFPRIAALAEVAWSAQAARNYANFLTRLPSMLPRWKAQGIAYANTPFQPIIAADKTATGAQVSLQEPFGYDVRYTTDGSAPSATSPVYDKPFAINVPATVQAQAFFNGKALANAAHLNITSGALRMRDNKTLAQCPGSGQLLLRLEDDGPREGERAFFNVDIFNPCWRWPQAPLAGMGAVEVRAGRLPYFFQLAHDEPSRTFKPAQTQYGELEIHARCDGPALAVVPLPEQVGADGFITLRAPITVTPADTELCVWFTGDTRPALWVLDRITLVPAKQ